MSEQGRFAYLSAQYGGYGKRQIVTNYVLRGSEKPQRHGAHKGNLKELGVLCVSVVKYTGVESRPTRFEGL
jgi:hypothetical protein